MNKYFWGVLSLFITVAAYAGITADQKFILNENVGAAAQRARLGTLIDQPGSLSVVWDASTGNFGSSTLNDIPPGGRGLGYHDLGVTIPKKSLITRAWVEVTKPWINVGAGVSPGIQFQCSTVTAGLTTVNLNSSTSYANDAAPGGALLALTAVDTLATMQRNESTEDCKIFAQVNGQNRTVGKITLFVKYLQIR